MINYCDLLFLLFSSLNFLCITSLILFSSKLYPLVQKRINIMTNIARIIINEKNPAFDLIFSFDPKTLQEVMAKFEISFLVSKKFDYFNSINLNQIYSN